MTNSDPEGRRPDRGSVIIAAAMLGSALILTFGFSGSAPRYQLVASSDAVVRMDNDSGAMIACDLQRCVEIQPPGRARTLEPLRNLVGGSRDDRQKQVAPSEPRQE